MKIFHYRKEHSCRNHIGRQMDQNTSPANTKVWEGGSAARHLEQIMQSAVSRSEEINATNINNKIEEKTRDSNALKYNGERIISSETHRKKINWTDVMTNTNKPNISPAVRHPIAKTKMILDKSNMQIALRPNPIAAYFRNVRRGPIVAIKNAFCLSRPSWALLAIRFVRDSVLEGITKTHLKTPGHYNTHHGDHRDTDSWYWQSGVKEEHTFEDNRGE